MQLFKFTVPFPDDMPSTSYINLCNKYLEPNQDTELNFKIRKSAWIKDLKINSLRPSGVIWRQIWVNIGSGNGLLPDGTKPLPEPMLTYQH